MRRYKNPLKTLNRAELAIWLTSATVTTAGFLIGGSRDTLTLIASLIGVTALIFVAKGDPIGQILTVVFAIFYSIISFQQRYYGEMITYLCMSSPIALVSAVSWFRHPYEVGKNEVSVARVSGRVWAALLALTLAVTFVFYFALKYFGTANLAVSTVSVATSFLAAALTFLRSPYYGLGYGANDIVLIVLWSVVSARDISYLPMVICFAVFLLNDCYGFFNWRRISRRQKTQ